MLQHGQGFTAVQLHGELGRQLGEPRCVLQAGQYLLGQRPGIDMHLRIHAGTRAEQQVAHIVTGRRCGPKPDRQQRLNQRPMLWPDTTYLQVATVGRLDHATGIALSHIGHRAGLSGGDRATVQFDPTDATIHCLDDTQQPRASRRAHRHRD